MALNNKKSVITVFTNKDSFASHQVLMALCEKALSFNAIEVDPKQKPEELLELNPHGTLPTLIDRDLVLYEPQIILEYLDERFPHPPLLPVYPITRAQNRSYIHRIKNDWYTLAEIIQKGSKDKAKAAKELTNSLTSLAPIFDNNDYFFSEEFTLTDCFLAPLLWRFEELGVTLPAQAKSIQDYAERIFNRPAFQLTLKYIEPEEDL